LKFPKKYTGPSLKQKKEDESTWLSDDELESYRSQNAELRRHFNVFAYLKDGHIFAKDYITKGEYSFENLGKMIRAWSKMKSNTESEFLSKTRHLTEDASQIKYLEELAPYFLTLPFPVPFASRFIKYGKKKGFTMNALSEAARHHLYDYVLYYVEGEHLTEQC